jgi:hypothetical protein
MTEYIDPKYQRRKKAIEEALEVLGPQARSVILAFLCHRKKITIGSDYCSPIEEIGASLEELFGRGAALIMDSIATRELRSS